jgi:hypothetical protein
MHRCWVLLVCAACSSSSQRFTKATSSVYVRSDSDRTTIVSPTASVAANVATNTAVDVAYEVDAWTGASVDVTTAATPAIHEVRNAATVGLTQTIGKGTVQASYRYSFEPDYWSHGLVLGGTLELAQRNTTLGAYALASYDIVGRAGDPFIRHPLRSGGGRLSIAQVLDRNTVADLTVEGLRLDGYMASPYRFVAVGGDGTCASGAPFCVPENVPDERLRVGVMARIRRSIARAWSIGAEYRFYADDWGVRSQTIQPEVTWRVAENGMLSLRYRYYTQNEATFYRPRYFELMDNLYLTRDRKLSAFYSNEVGLGYMQRLELCDGERVVFAGLRTTASLLDYLAFVGLDHVWALEATALLGLELP